MTRIIFCDLDGTLLPAGRDRLSSETLAHIKRITDRGVFFCVASGRPYSQLKALFGPLYRRIVFLCLDGALVMHRDCVLYKKSLSHPERLLSSLCEATLFTRGGEKQLAAGLSSAAISAEINRAGGEILKIALHGHKAQSDSARLCYQRGNIFEYVENGADKGSAATALLEKLRISADSAAALGDGENDIPLLRLIPDSFRTPVCHCSLVDLGLPPKTAEEFLKQY